MRGSSIDINSTRSPNIKPNPKFEAVNILQNSEKI